MKLGSLCHLHRCKAIDVLNKIMQNQPFLPFQVISITQPLFILKVALLAKSCPQISFIIGYVIGLGLPKYESLSSSVTLNVRQTKSLNASFNTHLFYTSQLSGTTNFSSNIYLFQHKDLSNPTSIHSSILQNFPFHHSS